MPYKILTVDDSRTIRMIIKKAFQNYECELFEAENGRDGLALAANIRPDLIILDITMPVMTGIEMLGKLLENDQLKETSVIMLTAESGRDNVMSIVKLGVKDYIVKPFKGEQLIERVKLILTDLKPKINLAGGQLEGEEGNLFAVVQDVVILTLPTRINRSKGTALEGMIKEKIDQMATAEAQKMVLNLVQVEDLSLTAIQSVANLVNQLTRAKISIRLSANEDQVGALKEFKETSVIPIHLSLKEAVTELHNAQ